MIGLTEAMSSFTGLFSVGGELQSMHASARRHVLLKVEADIWIGLVRLPWAQDLAAARHNAGCHPI